MLFHHIREIWRHFGVNQKASVILALVGTFAVIGGLLYWSARPEYRLLYSGLSLEDAAAMREKLDEERIRMQFKNAGRAIYVPAGDVYRARLLLAAEGYPQDTSAGFELFEEPKFGLTDFAQKVNYQRALQGELERTIATMDGIKSARVMLVLPEDRLFAPRDRQQTSASIMLTLAGGVALGPGQVRSIMHMVGSAVPGLSPSTITITDQLGNLLSRKSGGDDDDIEQTNEQLAAREKCEAFLAAKAQDMLDQALGPERSVVKVNVAMDFSRVERSSVTFDQENKTIRSETIETETSSLPGSSAAPAGIVANVPIGNPGAATMRGEQNKNKKENIRTEYEWPKETQVVVEKGARIKQISVSVCVARGETARTTNEIASISNMVKAAVGFVEGETRQDTIAVTEMEFAPVKGPPPVAWWERMPLHYGSLGKVVGGLVLLLALYVIGRRMLARTPIQREDVGLPIAMLTGGSEAAPLPAAPFDYGDEEASQRRLTEIAEIANSQPELLAAWLEAMVNAEVAYG